MSSQGQSAAKVMRVVGREWSCGAGSSALLSTPSTSWHLSALSGLPSPEQAEGFDQHLRSTWAPLLSLLCHPVVKAQPRLSFPTPQLNARKKGAMLGWMESGEHLPREDPPQNLQMTRECAESLAQARQGCRPLEGALAGVCPGTRAAQALGEESSPRELSRAGLQQSLPSCHGDLGVAFAEDDGESTFQDQGTRQAPPWSPPGYFSPLTPARGRTGIECSPPKLNHTGWDGKAVWESFQLVPAVPPLPALQGLLPTSAQPQQ